MVPYVSSPVARVLLAFLARHFAKNEVPGEGAVPEPPKKVAGRKVKFTIRYFYIPNFKLKTVNWSLLQEE